MVILKCYTVTPMVLLYHLQVVLYIQRLPAGKNVKLPYLDYVCLSLEFLDEFSNKVGTHNTLGSVNSVTNTLHGPV